VILEARGLSKSFGGIKALNGVDLLLRKGELAGLIGPNGSGKTTVFNVITGIYRPDRGTVTMETKRIAGLAPHRISRLGIARTFQNIRLFRNLSVLDNVRTAYHPKVSYGPVSAVCRTKKFIEGEKEIGENVADLLSLFSLQDRKGELAKNLSYGDQRRLEIARALASEPKILLLDEPAAGLSSGESREMAEFLKRLDPSLAILLIEHDMDVVFDVVSDISVLHFGTVVESGSCKDIQKSERVQQIYLGTG
jgi:branched-chain amino acid transport system ATP-binding protein